MGSKDYLAIILFGSIWGFLEATAGGALHIIKVPLTGSIMASIGFAILFAAMRAGVRPAKLFAISLVAASFKFIDPIIFSVPMFDRTVINPAIAIAAQGFAFSAAFLGAGREIRPLASATRLVAACALSMAAFNAISVGIFGWQTVHTLNPLNAALVQLPITVAATLLLSWIAGAVRLNRIASARPAFQLASAASFVIITILIQAGIR